MSPAIKIPGAGGPSGAGDFVTTLDAPSVTRLPSSTQPQFRNHRAFAVWAVMHGFASAERLTEMILAEIAEVKLCPSD